MTLNVSIFLHSFVQSPQYDVEYDLAYEKSYSVGYKSTSLSLHQLQRLLLVLYMYLKHLTGSVNLSKSPPYYNNQQIGETNLQHALVYICSYYMENNHQNSQFYL